MQELRSEIRDARIAAGLFEDDMAMQYGMTMELYRAFEQGRAELPEATVWEMAGDLGLPLDGHLRSVDTQDSGHAELP